MLHHLAMPLAKFTTLKLNYNYDDHMFRAHYHIFASLSLMVSNQYLGKAYVIILWVVFSAFKTRQLCCNEMLTRCLIGSKTCLFSVVWLQ